MIVPKRAGRKSATSDGVEFFLFVFLFSLWLSNLADETLAAPRGRIFGVQISDPVAPPGQVVASYQPGPLEHHQGSGGRSPKEQRKARQRREETISAALRDVPDPFLQPIIDRNQFDPISERPLPGLAFMECPSSFELVGERCMFTVFKDPVMSCPYGSYRDKAQNCIQADAVPPEFICPALFEEFIRGCIRRRFLPPQLLCPTGFQQHSDACVKVNLVASVPQCPDDFSLHFDTARGSSVCQKPLVLPPVVRCPKPEALPITAAVMAKVEAASASTDESASGAQRVLQLVRDVGDGAPLCMVEDEVPALPACSPGFWLVDAEPSVAPPTAEEGSRDSEKSIAGLADGTGNRNARDDPGGTEAPQKSSIVPQHGHPSRPSGENDNTVLREPPSDDTDSNGQAKNEEEAPGSTASSPGSAAPSRARRSDDVGTSGKSRRGSLREERDTTEIEKSEKPGKASSAAADCDTALTTTTESPKAKRPRASRRSNERGNSSDARIARKPQGNTNKGADDSNNDVKSSEGIDGHNALDGEAAALAETPSSVLNGLVDSRFEKSQNRASPTQIFQTSTATSASKQQETTTSPASPAIFVVSTIAPVSSGDAQLPTEGTQRGAPPELITVQPDTKIAQFVSRSEHFDSKGATATTTGSLKLHSNQIATTANASPSTRTSSQYYNHPQVIIDEGATGATQPPSSTVTRAVRADDSISGFQSAHPVDVDQSKRGAARKRNRAAAASQESLSDSKPRRNRRSRAKSNEEDQPEVTVARQLRSIGGVTSPIIEQALVEQLKNHSSGEPPAGQLNRPESFMNGDDKHEGGSHVPAERVELVQREKESFTSPTQHSKSTNETAQFLWVNAGEASHQNFEYRRNFVPEDVLVLLFDNQTKRSETKGNRDRRSSLRQPLRSRSAIQDKNIDESGAPATGPPQDAHVVEVDRLPPSSAEAKDPASVVARQQAQIDVLTRPPLDVRRDRVLATASEGPDIRSMAAAKRQRQELKTNRTTSAESGRPYRCVRNVVIEVIEPDAELRELQSSPAAPHDLIRPQASPPVWRIQRNGHGSLTPERTGPPLRLLARSRTFNPLAVVTGEAREQVVETVDGNGASAELREHGWAAPTTPHSVTLLLVRPAEQQLGAGPPVAHELVDNFLPLQFDLDGTPSLKERSTARLLSSSPPRHSRAPLPTATSSAPPLDAEVPQAPVRYLEGSTSVPARSKIATGLESRPVEWECPPGYILACQGPGWLKSWNATGAGPPRGLADSTRLRTGSESNFADSASMATEGRRVLLGSSENTPSPNPDRAPRACDQYICRRVSLTIGSWACSEATHLREPHVPRRHQCSSNSSDGKHLFGVPESPRQHSDSDDFVGCSLDGFPPPPSCYGTVEQDAVMVCPFVSHLPNKAGKCETVMTESIERRCPDGFRSAGTAGNKHKEKRVLGPASARSLKKEDNWPVVPDVLIPGLCESVEYAEFQSVCPQGYTTESQGPKKHKICTTTKRVSAVAICESGFLEIVDVATGEKACVKTLEAAPTLVAAASPPKHGIVAVPAGVLVADGHPGHHNAKDAAVPLPASSPDVEVSVCFITPENTLSCSAQRKFYGDVTDRGLKWGTNFKNRMSRKAATGMK